jgi:hypothetical protein
LAAAAADTQVMMWESLALMDHLEALVVVLEETKPLDLLEQVVLEPLDKVMMVAMALQRLLVVKYPQEVEVVVLEPLVLMVKELKEAVTAETELIHSQFGQQQHLRAKAVITQVAVVECNFM